jgi:hypothetical protein
MLAAKSRMTRPGPVARGVGDIAVLRSVEAGLPVACRMVCRDVNDREMRISMALPTLTPEQRQAALAKASEARKARSELLAALKSGTTSMIEVLAREDDVAKKTKVAAAVKALPGYGPAKAAAVLAQAGIPDTRRIGGLGDQQRRRLTEALGD